MNDWGKSYKNQLQLKGWPESLIDFYGHVYRKDMDSLISGSITEEIGHWWQPNMFTLTYGMHSLYETPDRCKDEGKCEFKGFKEILQEKGVQIKTNARVIQIKRENEGHEDFFNGIHHFQCPTNTLILL